MPAPDYHKAKFIFSAANIKQLTADEGIEVAFVGRSNAGKSSSLNALTNQKKLARTGKTPGRTQLLNCFELTEGKRLIDLPGFGYAKVPPEVKSRWQFMLDRYLRNRTCLKGIILLMDIRHPLQNFELQMIEWANHVEIPVHVLLTKADKLSKNASHNVLMKVKQELKVLPGILTVQLFSSHEQIGRDELVEQLDKWFSFE